MSLRRWEDLPAELRTEAVRPYYEYLDRKRFSLGCKRVFDVCASLILLSLIWPVFVILAAAVKLDSPGPVFYRQERVTRYGRVFRIHKFRSMCDGADRRGALVTVGQDARVTRVGRMIRACRLDETAQLIDVLKGDMSFVGTRPEVPKYVSAYTDEMRATLLLPAGVTSEASIRFKDEAALLDGAADPDEAYINLVLPGKMAINLRAVAEYGFWKEIGVLFRTVAAVVKK